MKNLFCAMKLEIRACLRQLSSTVSLNTTGRLLLAALAVILSAVLGYLRMTGFDMQALLTAGFAASFFMGWLSFNKRNAQELLFDQKTQLMRTLPMDFHRLQFIKLEKLIFASSLVYGVVIGYLLIILLLSGYCKSFIWMHTIGVMAAFCLMQNIRALLLNAPGKLKALKYPALIVLLGGSVWILQKQPDWRLLLCRISEFYTRNCVPITLVLTAALLLVKWMQLCRLPSDQNCGEKESTLGISSRMDVLISRMNDVVRRDLRIILHSAKERRILISRILFPMLAAWIAAALLRAGVLPLPVSRSLTLWMLALMLGSGNSSLFERQMTMGYEGNMVLAYVLSGCQISKIQLQRLKGSLAIVIPVTVAASLLTALILGANIAETAAGMVLGAVSCASASSFTAYYMIKGTSYINDLNRPKFSSGLILQVFRTGMEMVLLLPLSLMELTSSGTVQYLIVALYAAACCLLALIFTRKIRKGDKHFYGEYQFAA